MPWWGASLPIAVCGLLAAACFLKAKQLLRRASPQADAASLASPGAVTAADTFLAETVKSGVLDENPLYIAEKMLEAAEDSGCAAQQAGQSGQHLYGTKKDPD